MLARPCRSLPSLDKRTAGRPCSKRCTDPHDLIDCALKGMARRWCLDIAGEEYVSNRRCAVRGVPSLFTWNPGTSSAAGGSTWIHGDCALVAGHCSWTCSSERCRRPRPAVLANLVAAGVHAPKGPVWGAKTLVSKIAHVLLTMISTVLILQAMNPPGRPTTRARCRVYRRHRHWLGRRRSSKPARLLGRARHRLQLGS